ncbi:cytidylate kinase-like family protein [Hungatella hathewayi]|uniref:cytidylate kinase-like family protein n=1 Tax=Hungatella hathewayi TaxID=154046 RepID=UPI001FA72A8B|nr:cytidylate kinase-like family protein [Hungatella hathewayi]
MERAITISREFGSGGRELGVRLADDDDKIRLNQRKPSKYKGLSRFGPEKTCNESTNL